MGDFVGLFFFCFGEGIILCVNGCIVEGEGLFIVDICEVFVYCLKVIVCLRFW